MKRSVRFPPRPKPPHHRGTYHQQAKAVRDRANSDPLTRCFSCGRMAHEHPPHKNGRMGHWQAGHIVDGQVGGTLLPQWSTCNVQAGARLGNQRSRRIPRRSRVW